MAVVVEVVAMAVNGKMRAVSVYVTHQCRIMEATIQETHQEMLTLAPLLFVIPA